MHFHSSVDKDIHIATLLNKGTYFHRSHDTVDYVLAPDTRLLSGWTEHNIAW